MHYAKSLDTESQMLDDDGEPIELNQDANYPTVVVKLVGEDGNAFSIMGRVAKALKRAGISQSEVDRFYEECKSSGSYDNLLVTVMQWVTVL